MEGEQHRELNYISKDLNILFKSINMVVSDLKKFTI